MRKTDDPKLTELLDISTMFGNYVQKLPQKKAENFNERCRTRFGAYFNRTGGFVSHTVIKKSPHVLIGHFTTDPLEKESSKLRQGSGGTYFLSF